MIFSNKSRIMQKTLVALILGTLACFAWYFTLSDLDELQTKYENKRIFLAKLLTREVTQLYNDQIDLTPRLSNFLAQENVAYSIVQQPDGLVIAQAENSPVPLDFFSEIEAKALKITNMQLFSITETSQTFSIREVAIPIAAENSKKLILRIGFFTKHEAAEKRKIIFRNVLVFTVLIFSLLAYWLIRKHKVSNLYHTLLGGTAVVILLLFFSSRLTVQNWYDRHWRANFVRNGLHISKLITPAAIEFLSNGQKENLNETFKIISEDEDFSYIAVIKDDRFVFHSDASLINSSVLNDKNYLESLNSNRPRVFKSATSEGYETMIPILNGHHRLGTVKTGFRISGAYYTPLIIIKERLVLLFASTLLILLFLMHLLSKRITKEISWFITAMERVTAGDLRQSIYIERNDEFGQLAHSFNFMLLSLKDKELVSKGLQQYVSKSIVDKTLKILSTSGQTGEKVFAITVFVYFSGIDEAIGKIDGKQIFEAAKDIYSRIRKIYPSSKDISFQILPSGIMAICTNRNKHKSLLKAINISKLLSVDIGRKPNLPFAPKITLHASEMLIGKLTDTEGSSKLIGDGFLDFRSIARIQNTDEVIVSRQIQVLMKDVLHLDELEILSGEKGRFSVFVVKDFKQENELIDTFKTSSSWAKIMILRILKLSSEIVEPKTIMNWFLDKDADVRFHVLDIFEQHKHPEIWKFIENVLETEKDIKVVSKALKVLGKIGNESHIELILEKLKSSERRIKANAVEALEAIGGKKVYEFLNVLIDEPDNRVKANILIALGKYGDLKVFELLTKMMLDSDHNIRASAAYALGKLGMAQGVEPLINAINDEDPSVRKQVAASLILLKSDLDR